MDGGLLSFELPTGVSGREGTTLTLTCRRGRGTLEMVETIVRRQLPDRFHGTCDAKAVHNVCNNQFIDIHGTASRWAAHKFFAMNGFMKTVGLLFGSMFRKRTLQAMRVLNGFAESRAP